jgi:hypothetical protein
LNITRARATRTSVAAISPAPFSPMGNVTRR